MMGICQKIAVFGTKKGLHEVKSPKNLMGRVDLEVNGPTARLMVSINNAVMYEPKTKRQPTSLRSLVSILHLFLIEKSFFLQFRKVLSTLLVHFYS